jgi:hypothetical protein
MRYEEAMNLTDEKFRRLTGVKKATFIKMVAILQEAHTIKKARGGRPNKISLEDILLMSLEYLREYRTYFHIAGSYGLSESYAYKLIRWTEDTLIKSGAFSLPGKKALYGDTLEYSIVLIDATETPIERPEKNRGTTIQERKKDIPLKHRLL